MSLEPTYLLPALGVLKPTATPINVLLEMLVHLEQVNTNVFKNPTEKRQTLYYSALADLASSYDEADGPPVYECYALTMPDGTLLEAASAYDLRCHTLALHGLARDRFVRGPAARPLSTWLEAADAVLGEYRQPQPQAA